MQVTFFRNRPGVAEESRSRFAPKQLLFAHAAIALPERGRLIVDQRAAREGLGLAEAAQRTTDAANRRLVARARRSRVHDAHPRARVHARPEIRTDAGTAPAGRRRGEPQGPVARAGEPLLQRAASRDARHAGSRRSRARGHRRRVARSRMVQRIPRRGRARLGLGGRQPRRRRCADGVSHPRPRGRDVLGRRRASRCVGTRHGVRTRRDPLHDAAHVALAAHGHRLSRRGAGAGRHVRRHARTAVRRPGARRACERGHRLLGRRSHRAPRRSHRRPRLSRAYRLRRAAAA